MEITNRFACRQLRHIIALGIIFALFFASGLMAADSFVVYAGGGPAFPSGSDFDNLKTGFSAGGGLAIGLGKSNSVSGEFGLHLDFYRFSREEPSKVLQLTHESFTALDIIGRLRFKSDRPLRPYALLGLGLFDLGGFGGTSTVSIGAGADIAFGAHNPHLFFVEIRHVNGSNFSIVRVNAGIRLG